VPLKKDYYLAEAKIELTQPGMNQSIALRSVVLKTNPAEKAKMLVVTNLTAEQANAQEIADAYLSCWPYPQEAFEDYSRQVELFTYTANSQHFFSIDYLSPGQEVLSDIQGLFDYYLHALDLYLRWYFLPPGYENKDFLTTKSQFYDLKVRLKEENGYLQAIFELPSDYPFKRDLEYLCRKLNEREIELVPGKRAWFLV
jgi:hypothetical protein